MLGCQDKRDMSVYVHFDLRVPIGDRKKHYPSLPLFSFWVVISLPLKLLSCIYVTL